MDVACAQGVGVTITTGAWLERCVLIDLLVAMDRVLGQMRVFLANLASSRFRKAPQWRIPCGASRERAQHAIKDPDTVNGNSVLVKFLLCLVKLVRGNNLP